MNNKIAMTAAGFAIAATAVFAASHAGPFDGPITARQSHMKLYAHNLGILGGMAKGAIEYNADTASVAATNLATMASLSQANYWPQGSDSDANENTDALPKIWESFPDVGAKGKALAEAANAMNAVAGNGLAELQAAMGAVGGACSECHKAYRKPK